MVVPLLSALLGSGAINSLLDYGLYVLLLLVLRRRAVAIPVFVLLEVGQLVMTENPVVGIAHGILAAALLSVAVLRFGLLAAFGLYLALNTLTSIPLPLDTGAAYGSQTIIFLILLSAFFLYALRTAVGPRPLFRFAVDT